MPRLPASDSFHLEAIALPRAASGIDFKTVVLPCGHYTTGETPFKYTGAYHVVKFLAKNL